MLRRRRLYCINERGHMVPQATLVSRVRSERPSKLMQFLYCVVLIAALIVITGAADAKYPGHMVSETYEAQPGDTLWSISWKYMEKNTYGPREFHEFQEGIVELNYDKVFVNREDGEIYPGDTLEIHYWVRD